MALSEQVSVEMPFVLEPEVAGGHGEGSVLDTSVHPPIVSEVEYEVAGWLGDDLIECFPVYFVSPRLLAAMKTAKLTGFAVNSNCRVTVNEQAHDELDGSEVLAFKWIDIHGTASDDLHVTSDLRLGVSDRAWDVFSRFTLNYCDIREASLDDEGGI